MSQDPTNAEPALLEEQLSAYLDGELDDEAAQQVERLLAADPKVRETLQRMERTWEVLNKLDEAEVDDRFTRSTLEMVSVEAEEEIQSQAKLAPRRRRKRWLIGGACVVGSAAAGLLITAFSWPNPNRQLLDDLPVLHDLNEYRQIGDFEFLKALYDEGLFIGEGDEDDGQ